MRKWRMRRAIKIIIPLCNIFLFLDKNVVFWLCERNMATNMENEGKERIRSNGKKELTEPLQGNGLKSDMLILCPYPAAAPLPPRRPSDKPCKNPTIGCMAAYETPQRNIIMIVRQGGEQSCCDNRHRIIVSSCVRRVFFAGPRIQGWGLYRSRRVSRQLYPHLRLLNARYTCDLLHSRLYRLMCLPGSKINKLD